MPESNNYPNDIDCIWIGQNRDGELAAFITAGAGPIPRNLLCRCDFESLEREILRALAPSTDADVLIAVPKPEGYQQLARRGFYVYDWQDFHRTKNDATGTYDLVAVPKTAIRFESMPEDLRTCVVELEATSFTATMQINGVCPAT